MIFLRQQNGLSLFEVLASIVLTLIVGTVVLNALVSANKQYNYQLNESISLNDISSISLDITKDFRKSTVTGIRSQMLFFFRSNYVLIDNSLYHNRTLKNPVKYAAKISIFCVADLQKDTMRTNDCKKIKIPNLEPGDGIYVYIQTEDGKKVETTLYSRGVYTYD